MSKENINLPKTSFSMKANLPSKEPEILKIWENLNLYKKKLRVYFIKRIRSDKKFKNSLRLVKQMNKDVILIKKGLKGKMVI